MLRLRMSNENCFIVKWSIKNFSVLWQDGGSTIYSPEFNPENMEGTRWRLRLSPNGGETMECICVQLLRLEVDDGPEDLDIWYHLSFLASDESLKLHESVRRFARDTYSSELNVKQNEVLYHKNDEYLSEDTLTVCCNLWSKDVPASKIGICFAQTTIGTANLIFSGVLRRFSSLVPHEEQTVQLSSESPEFHFVRIGISLTEKGRVLINRKRNIYRSLSLRSSKLYLMDNTGNKVECTQGRPDWMNLSRECKFTLPLTKTDLTRNKELYLPNDSLTFQYEVTFFPGKESEAIEDPEYTEGNLAEEPEYAERNLAEESEYAKRNLVEESEYAKRNLAEESEYAKRNPANATDENDLGKNEQPHLPTTFKDDMLSLYNSSVYHDILLRVGAEAVPAHKDILRSRSLVFKEILSTDRKDKAIKGIEIMNLNLDTVKRMLLFLYTDTTGELELQSAKKLYFASDEYGISSLKQRCSIFMKQNLKPSNACEILVLADTHQDEELKSAVQEYILKDDGEVLGSDMWESFSKSNIYLAAQVMYLKCLKLSTLSINKDSV